MAQTGAGVVAAASTLLSVLTSEPRCTRREQSLSLAEPGVILVWLALYLVNWLSLMKLKGSHDLDLNLHPTTWHPRSPSLCLQRLNSRLIYIQFPPGVPPWTPPRWLTLSPGPSLKPAPPRSPISSAGRGLARPEADRCTSSVTPGAHQSLTCNESSPAYLAGWPWGQNRILEHQKTNRKSPQPLRLFLSVQRDFPHTSRMSHTHVCSARGSEKPEV